MTKQDTAIADYLTLHSQLEQAVEGVDSHQLTWKKTPASWSILEVLSHLLDHHLVVAFRIRHVIAGGEAALPIFNQDVWVSESRANEERAEDILGLYQALLLHNARLFGRLPEETWDKAGTTPKGAVIPLREMVSGFIAHVQVHLAQIERIKQSYLQRDN